MPQSFRGITLIETVIYASLVSMVVGIFSLVLIQVTTSTQRELDRQTVYATEFFVTQKVASLLNGVTASAVTPTSGSSASLSITAANGTVSVIDVDQSALRLTKTSGSTATTNRLTNSHVVVSDLSFERQTVNNQPAIRMMMTLQGQSDSTSLDKTYYLQ
jgi:hypothetical protein